MPIAHKKWKPGRKVYVNCALQLRREVHLFFFFLLCAFYLFPLFVLFSLEKRRLQEDLREAFQYRKGGCKKEGDRDFSRVCCDKTRGNDFKLKEGTFRLDIRKKITIRLLLKHWKWMPREVEGPLFLETLKVRLDRALSTWWSWRCPLFIAGELD